MRPMLSCCQRHKAFLLCRNPDTLKRLQETEKQLKEQTESAYVNLDISNEEKEKGNQVNMLATSAARA